MTTPTLEINFNNYRKTDEEAFGSISNGISIYNQRYPLMKALKEQLSLDQIKALLERVIKGTLVKIDTTATSNPFNEFEYVQSSQGSSTYLLKKNQIMIFESKRTVNGEDYYSYYCYFKDNGSNNDEDGNVWLIFITLAKVQTENQEEGFLPYPVIFDLQDSLEPKFVGENVIVDDTTTPPTTQFTIKSCFTGNFDIETVGTSLNYANIKLKNTAFNLSYEEKKEATATIIPMGGFKASI